MSRFWSPAVHNLTPYVPGEQPKLADLVKLNTNENPYGPSPHAIAAMQAELGDTLKLYPDPTGEKLKQAVARFYGLSTKNVFVGNGSDEVLAHAFLGLLKHERPILFPDITYSFYPVYCGLYDIDYRTVPLDDQFRLNAADYAAPNGGVIFPNPNAPTGILLGLDQVEAILTANPDSPVIVDEAYVDFGGDAIPTAAGLIARHPNLLVVQTLSKSRSLAGLRVGFALGSEELIEGLERVKDSFNSYPLDRLALAGATAAIEDRAHFDTTRKAVMASREKLTGRLNDLGFDVLPSAANFIFARHPHHAAADLAQALRERSIIVRYFAKPRIDQFLRITIGTEVECERLAAALDAILA